eukprot:scaffold573_cov309-Chaetoceros_neogracile.AAC.1
MTYTIEGTAVLVDEDSSPDIPTVQLLSAIQKYAVSIVKGVAGEAKIGFFNAGPMIAMSESMVFLSDLTFDSSSRNFCLVVEDIDMDAKFYMRPCGSLTKQSNKKLWSFDHKGQIRNTNNPQWCMAWAGGKKKELWLEKCDTTKKTASFEYVKSQKAIAVTNTKNDKKFLIGFNTVKKYGKLRLYGVNSKNTAVSSFLMMVVPTHVLSDAPSAPPSGEPSLPPSPMPSDLPSKQPTPSPTAKPTRKRTPSPTAKPTSNPTLSCDVTTFSDLIGAIPADDGSERDIKLCSTPIIFTEQITVSNKTLTFTCPNSDCVLDAESSSSLFLIDGGTISFDGITFKNGSAPGMGGAIHIANAGGSVVVITGSKFINNKALGGGAIFNGSGGGSMEITGSEFEGNTASTMIGGNNIYNENGGDISCNDVTNTFEFPPGGITSDNDFQGNYPVLLCIPNCHVDRPDWIGDEYCHGGDYNIGYNTEECGFDGGDCETYNSYLNCTVEYPGRIGSGYCDDGDYNTEECGFDGGDCETYNSYTNCTVENPGMIGSGYCDDGDYNIGYNTEECGFDGGDCETYNSYLNCTVEYPGKIGSGYCHGGDYNTEECGFDGGDCVEFNTLYPNCTVDNPGLIGSGYCHGGDYNTEECGFDGGDCETYNSYPNCTVANPGWIEDGDCDGDAYNTDECGFDGGD